jgi:hypothetical protein
MNYDTVRAKEKNARRRNAVIAGEKGIQRGFLQREVLPMSEVIPFPKPRSKPRSKPKDDESEEFLKLLLLIRSSRSK